ncbi:MAG: serine/threonine protein kinase [Kofleriaceae bacterium]
MAPNCYDAEAISSGTPVRIELASEADSALIDIRFTRAQLLLVHVDHPHVAKIIDHGVLSNGRPWVVSERPPGTALSDVLAQRRLEARETTALIYSVAQVLAFAHHRQVVHGSLRPHHLTLSRGAKVSISGWAWLRTPGLPAFGDPANTSVYNSPEHDGQSPIDGRADVYALGAIAYRALTGVFPDVSRDLLDGNDPLGRAIENMLSLDARDRNSAAAIVADLHIQRQTDRAARSSKSEIEPSSRASSPSVAAVRSRRASSAPIALEDDDLEDDKVRPSHRASESMIVEARSTPSAAIALDANRAPAESPDLAERLALAEKEIEELRAAAKRESSENVRAKRPSSDDLHRTSSADLQRPSASRTIEIVSVLGDPWQPTPVPELDARTTNRMPSPRPEQLEPVEQVDTELAIGSIDRDIDQPTDLSPPLEISSHDPITDLEDRCTSPMDASTPDPTDRYLV